MDLGLSALTDDQLLDLLQQACGELVTRDPFVRGLAQAAIFTESEKLAAIKKEAAKCVENVRREYIQQIGKEVAQSVRDSYKAGKLRLLDSKQEANAATTAEVKERIALIDETIKKLKAGDAGRFAFEITGQYIAFSHAGKNYQTAKKLPPDTVEKVGNTIKGLLEK
jgi:hypothetical protein